MVLPTPDDERFRALASRNAAALARLASHYEASPEARRDLEQEILVALWRAHGSFRGESSERTWVYRIAHNVAATYVARAIRTRRDADVPEPEPQRGPEEVAGEREAVRRIERRIRALDLPSRQLALLALEGCTTAEIAEITGLTPTNVTTRLSRLRKALASEEPT
ncbi:MAG: sigma-70 family RNA polymerase sigma factor [Labilithrix sp.]|nr:sigma-70 family RNA polymerase sigma factor [Labilithrix sp.]